MKRVTELVVLAALALAGCSKSQPMEAAPAQEARTYDFKEGPAPAVQPPGIVAADQPQQSSTVTVAPPRIAYIYRRHYRLDGQAIPRAQQAHVALCDALGPARCRILTMERASADADYASGTLSLQVDARLARAFGDRLDGAVAGDGGALIGSGIEAEDLSKQIVDTEARIRAKQALADRLMALLANRGAKVGELVEAERALADAQEELDAARTWLAEMRGRVATSRYDLRYQASAPNGEGWLEPVRRAFAESAGSFGASLGALVAFVVMALPWVLLGWGLVWLLRRRGWRPRWRFWRRPPPAP